jgi:transcriptional regulator with XRE-family HTH domain
MTEKQLIKAIEVKRKILGLSKAELCRRAERTQQSYTNLLKGTQSPKLESFAAFRKAVGFNSLEEVIEFMKDYDL